MSPGAQARRRGFIRLVAVIVSIAIVVLGVGLVRRGVAAAAYVNEAPLPVATATPLAPPAIAAPAPPAAPPATTGTITRPAQKRVAIDGAPMRATSLTLACGAHSVKVGAAKAKTLDVPCGGTLTLK